MADPKKPKPLTETRDPVVVSSPKSGDTVHPTFTAVGTFERPSGITDVTVSVTCGGKSATATVDHPRTGVWVATLNDVPVGDNHTLVATRTIPNTPPKTASENPIKVVAQPQVSVTNMLQGASVSNHHQATVTVTDAAVKSLHHRLISTDPNAPPPATNVVAVAATGEYTMTLSVLQTGYFTFEVVGKNAANQVLCATRIGEMEIT